MNPIQEMKSVPEPYTARPATAEDAPQIAALIAACQAADGLAAEMTVEELRNDWRGVDLRKETALLHTPDGQFAAYADLLHQSYRQVNVYGYVHPAHRGRGLGRFLVRWGEAWARNYRRQAPESDLGPLYVHHFIPTPNEGARRLLEREGYEPIRTHYWMEVTFQERPPAPAWPAGITVRQYVPGQDEEALFEAGEEAFGDIWGRAAGTLESWTAATRDEDFDASLWFLARDQETGEVAAVCLCSATSESGTVNSLGVRRPWRRRGLGLALLHHAFGAFYERGIRKAGLSVDSDSPTGAPRLYSRAGMHVAESYVRYRKTLVPNDEAR